MFDRNFLAISHNVYVVRLWRPAGLRFSGKVAVPCIWHIVITLDIGEGSDILVGIERPDNGSGLACLDHCALVRQILAFDL